MFTPAAVRLASGVALCAVHSALGAQTPTRRGTVAQIAAARQTFEDGLAAVSRNRAAFMQEADPMQGCAVTLTVRRAIRADSLHQLVVFDAGSLSTDMQMSMDAFGGIILFSYRTVNGAPVVARTRTRQVAGQAQTPETERVGALEVLVAETSQQAAVVAFTKGWTDLVQVCGGEVAPAR